MNNREINFVNSYVMALVIMVVCMSVTGCTISVNGHEIKILDSDSTNDSANAT